MASPRLLDLDEIIDSSRVAGLQIMVMALCAAVAMLDGFDTQAIAFVAPAIAASWHVDPAAFGPVFGAGLFGGLIGALALGRAGDRFGRKPVLLLAVLVFAIGSLATPGARSVAQLIAIRFITGLGLGGALPCFISMTSEYAPKRLRTTLVSLMFCGFPLGAVIGGIVSARLIPAFGWESVFIGGGILPLALLPLLMLYLPESIRYLALRNDQVKISELLTRMQLRSNWSGQVGYHGKHATVPVSHLFKDGRGLGTALLWIALFCSLLMTYFLINWIPVLAHRSGMPIGTAVLAVSMLNLGSIFGCVVLGRLADRFKVALVLCCAYGCGALAIASLGLAGESGVLLCAVAFVVGAFSIGAQLCTVALIAAYYETFLRATGIGWSMGIGRVGAISGPVLGGLLLGIGMNASTLFVLAGAISLIAAACVFIVGHKVLSKRPLGGAEAAPQAAHQ